jgi:hypothetical protein
MKSCYPQNENKDGLAKYNWNIFTKLQKTTCRFIN